MLITPHLISSWQSLMINNGNSVWKPSKDQCPAQALTAKETEPLHLQFSQQAKESRVANLLACSQAELLHIQHLEVTHFALKTHQAQGPPFPSATDPTSSPSCFLIGFHFKPSAPFSFI